jgi:hypothetical protein
MVVTPTAVFIHFHKAGGQFVNRLLLRHVPDSRRIGYHLPRSETPSELAALPAFGFIRNPWDWYVSWYSFNSLNPERNPIFRIASLNGSLGFHATVENLLRLGQPDRQPMRDRIAEALPATRENNMGSGITSTILSGMDEPERGYLTWLWRYMFFCKNDLDGVTLGRFENLRVQIIDLLEKHDLPISALLLEAIESAPAVNSSPHRHYRDYYDSELSELVSIKDHEYIQAGNYEF